ncbi:MAG: hypothetical protein C4345_09925, partial [Chloroflexota bacterium]
APALVEVAGDAALTAEAQDYRGLARQVAALLLDGHLRGQLVQRGRARAAQFTWERTDKADLLREQAGLGDASADGDQQGTRALAR